MRKIKIVLFVSLIVFVSLASAEHDDNVTTEAAIGGGLGGAAGGAIGAEIGGREGAVLGAAAGAALGTVIATDKKQIYSEDHRYHRDIREPVPYSTRGRHPSYRHCPPGQAKKGRC